MKSAAITIRIPPALKNQLEARAKAQHRSLSAQVVADLERAPGSSEETSAARGRFLGLFEGTRLPSDRDIEEVRSLLWGKSSRFGQESRLLESD